jgi:hypothetical protein
MSGLPAIVTALSQLNAALAAAGATKPITIVVDQDDEAVLREFFSKWRTPSTPDDVLYNTAGVDIVAPGRIEVTSIDGGEF